MFSFLSLLNGGYFANAFLFVRKINIEFYYIIFFNVNTFNVSLHMQYTVQKYYYLCYSLQIVTKLASGKNKNEKTNRKYNLKSFIIYK